MNLKRETLNGPEPIGCGSWIVSAFCGLFIRSARIGSQTCFGIRLILASVEMRKAALGVFSLKRTVRSSTADTSAMLATNGLYIGDLSAIAGALKENTTSSTVSGLPSCHFWPGRSTQSTVEGSAWTTFSAAQGIRQAVRAPCASAGPRRSR